MSDKCWICGKRLYDGELVFAVSAWLYNKRDVGDVPIGYICKGCVDNV